MNWTPKGGECKFETLDFATLPEHIDWLPGRVDLIVASDVASPPKAVLKVPH